VSPKFAKSIIDTYIVAKGPINHFDSSIIYATVGAAVWFIRLSSLSPPTHFVFSASIVVQNMFVKSSSFNQFFILSGEHVSVLLFSCRKSIKNPQFATSFATPLHNKLILFIRLVE